MQQLGPVEQFYKFLIGQEAFHEWGYPGTTPLGLFTASNHSILYRTI